MLEWGLLPAWAKNRTASRCSINARAETVAEKPMFRDVLRRRRCAVPGGELHPCDHGAERAGGEGARPDAGDAVSRRVNKPENERPELIQLDESAKEPWS